MFGGCLHKYKHRISTIGSDIIPNSVDWSDIKYYFDFGPIEFTSKQITGINSNISIKINLSSSNPLLYYKVTSNQVTSGSGTPISDGYTQITDNNLISNIANNQWITFRTYVSYITSYGPTTVTVKNNSDNDSVLDTFNIQSQESPD